MTTLVVLLGVVGNGVCLVALRDAKVGGRELVRTLTGLALWDTALLLAVFAYYPSQNLAMLFQIEDSRILPFPSRPFVPPLCIDT